MKKINLFLWLSLYTLSSFGQSLKWKNQEFELRNVKASLVPFKGEKVLKVERDLQALPFDLKNLAATVDEPTYVKLKNVNFQDGIIEVKVLSQIQNPSPFEGSQGFIGLAFRISNQDAAFESIYLRPKAGRSERQFDRNHTVQYYAYPDYKFDRLRQEGNGAYETYADVGLNEWIALRIEVHGASAKLYVNHQKSPSFIVEKLKGATTNGGIAMWVDIGTVGYFKDLKITKLK